MATLLSIDEMQVLVGEYGRFQKIINLMFCITIFPSMFPLLIMYFASVSPPWRMVSNGTTTSNITFHSNDPTRCKLQRNEWEFVKPREYSIVTEFDLVCDKEYMVELTTSILFFGFMFGAIILGWCADNYGRKKVHYVSIGIVIVLSFLSIFIGNIYAFIVSRFVVGFFLHGTFPQVTLMISEIVGNEHRAFCNTTVTISVGLSLSLLALKAYFISTWKLLFIVCTIPYIFVLLFYLFVPESVRYLRVKGRIDEAMLIFKRMADWNKAELLPHLSITPVDRDTAIHKSSHLDLFRTGKMACTTIVLSFSALTTSMANYCLLLAAGDISGHMYRDFAVINLVRIPVGFINPPLVNYFGRKRITMIYFLIGAGACIALGFTPKIGNMKVLRVALALFGLACICGGGLGRRVWALELYPTHCRGEGTGFAQLLNKIGATSSSWVDNDMSKVYEGGAFILIGVLNIISFCLQTSLPETNGVNTADTEKEFEKNKTVDEQVEMEEQYDHKVTSYTNPMSQIDEDKA